MAPSMRLKAIRRPPASHTATLILMFSSLALSSAPGTARLASARVRAMSCPPAEYRVWDRVMTAWSRRHIGSTWYHRDRPLAMALPPGRSARRLSRVDGKDLARDVAGGRATEK